MLAVSSYSLVALFLSLLLVYLDSAQQLCLKPFFLTFPAMLALALNLPTLLSMPAPRNIRLVYLLATIFLLLAVHHLGYSLKRLYNPQFSLFLLLAMAGTALFIIADPPGMPPVLPPLAVCSGGGCTTIASSTLSSLLSALSLPLDIAGPIFEAISWLSIVYTIYSLGRKKGLKPKNYQLWASLVGGGALLLGHFWVGYTCILGAALKQPLTKFTAIKSLKV